MNERTKLNLTEHVYKFFMRDKSNVDDLIAYLKKTVAELSEMEAALSGERIARMRKHIL